MTKKLRYRLWSLLVTVIIWTLAAKILDHWLPGHGVPMVVCVVTPILVSLGYIWGYVWGTLEGKL